MNVIIFQLSITTTVKKGKKNKKKTMNTVFYYKCSVLGRIWEKGKKKRF